MKQAFKPLGIAAAVAAATSGYVSAQNPSVPNNDLGDLALVPYYTVQEGFVTGIHIVNTSASTQVVKFRFRRATDSMDALDFNVIMSPQDVYAGFLSQQADGDIVWAAEDTSCTAPETSNGVLEMPAIFRAGAETGYVEIVAMAETSNESQQIAEAAEHVYVDDDAGTPADCGAVRANFLADGNGVANTDREFGVEDYDTTWGPDVDGDPEANSYVDSDNPLKVSYFIQDFNSGLEFGDNAVMVKDFLTEASMTNQEFGIISGDLNGFDHPDLNGAGPVNSAASGESEKFNLLRSSDVLGAQAIVNEWSNNPSNSVDLDWIVTLPGQYTMLDRLQYIGSLEEDGSWVPTVANGVPVENEDCLYGICDYRDQPVQLTFAAYNREELLAEGDTDRGLVISPSTPDSIPRVYLPKEANVITFGDGQVFGDEDVNISADLRQPFGWVAAAITSRGDVSGSFVERVCAYPASADVDLNGASDESGEALAGQNICTPLTGNVPVIGMAAWARSVSANPDANYGRIIEHSYVTSS